MWFSFKFQCCSGGMQKLLVSAVLAIEKCIKDDGGIDKKKKILLNLRSICTFQVLLNTVVYRLKDHKQIQHVESFSWNKLRGFILSFSDA